MSMSNHEYSFSEFTNLPSPDGLPKKVRHGVFNCIESAFGGTVTTEDAAMHMQGDQVLVIYDRTDTVVGFSATRIMHGESEINGLALPAEQAYFAAAAIAKPFQGNGLYNRLNQKRMDFVCRENINDIVTRTQNPRVEQGITRAVQRLVSGNIVGSFAIARQLTVGAYGHMLTAVRPYANNVRYDNIDYNRGDANLIAWLLQQEKERTEADVL